MKFYRTRFFDPFDIAVPGRHEKLFAPKDQFEIDLRWPMLIEIHSLFSSLDWVL
jgi:hypothetical protein